MIRTGMSSTSPITGSMWRTWSGCWERRRAKGQSNSSGNPAAWGYTPDGTYIIVIYQQIDQDTIRVVTAFEVPEPGA